MYAVIRTGGKQYRVTSGAVIKIDRIEGEAGGTVEFSDVLMLGGEGWANIGDPLVDGLAVAGEVVQQSRSQTTVRITDIVPNREERRGA